MFPAGNYFPQSMQGYTQRTQGFVEMTPINPAFSAYNPAYFAGNNYRWETRPKQPPFPPRIPF